MKKFESQSWDWEDPNPLSTQLMGLNLICWLPPPMGAFKLNFDASIFNDAISIAYIIRDCHEFLVYAGAS